MSMCLPCGCWSPCLTKSCEVGKSPDKKVSSHVGGQDEGEGFKEGAKRVAHVHWNFQDTKKLIKSFLCWHI